MNKIDKKFYEFIDNMKQNRPTYEFNIQEIEGKEFNNEPNQLYKTNSGEGYIEKEVEMNGRKLKVTYPEDIAVFSNLFESFVELVEDELKEEK